MMNDHSDSTRFGCAGAATTGTGSGRRDTMVLVSRRTLWLMPQ